MSEPVEMVTVQREHRQKRQQRQEHATPMRPIEKLLVANRGEIARRILRTCRDMGIATVAVFSDADATAQHTLEADEAVRLGASAAAESYLSIPALIEAAHRTGADALHPGYGFLAENAALAAACQDGGITFVGPRSEVIAAMGSKREAKRLAVSIGVPVVPGYEGDDQSDSRLLSAAREIGYPVMIKASAGGGGKGMRVVADEPDLMEALVAARREARAAFGDDTLLLERAISEPRHVEVQIFGDDFGNVIHLGERECTIQRRHQKIIEETPSTALTPELRARMTEAAIAIGSALGYTSAGTVEFILTPEGQFYFLEVNTRLQVEHPITELVTGLDLVRWQILAAQGQRLPLRQDEVRFAGHAIEARIYAEDPAHGFLPTTGTIALWREPGGAGIRVDAGIHTGDVVTPHYDPMLAKISSHGADRDEALRRLDRALARAVLFGVRNNLGYLRRVIRHPAHRAGEISTAFVDRHTDELLSPESHDIPDGAGATRAALLAALHRALASDMPGGWRNSRSRPAVERFHMVASTETRGEHGTDEHTVEVRLTPRVHGHFSAQIAWRGATQAFDVLAHTHDGPDLAIELNGLLIHGVVVETQGHIWWVKVGDDTHQLVWQPPLREPEERVEATGTLAAPMPGRVVHILASEGQEVHAGDPLLVLEAMKMEHTVRAPYDGTVVAFRFGQGEQVMAGDALAEVLPLTLSES